MGKINPELRFWFEELPIALKNRILESGLTIRTKEELDLCVKQLKAQERCCGDL